MEWNIQDLGAAGEFISSIAVLVTLVYLAVQVRQSKAVVIEGARAARLQTDVDLLLFSAGDTILPSAMAKVLAQDGIPNSEDSYVGNLIERYGFEIEEAVRIQSWCFAWLKRQEHSFLQPLDKNERSLVDRQILQFLGWPWCDKFWVEDGNRLMFDERFAAHIDHLLAK